MEFFLFYSAIYYLHLLINKCKPKKYQFQGFFCFFDKKIRERERAVVQVVMGFIE